MFRTIFDKERKQWSGPKTESIFNPHSSLGNVILNVLQVNGSRVAQICADTGNRTTFDELHTLTVRVAKRLRNFEFEKGQVIFFLTNNSADIPVLVFAAMCLGCPVASLPSFHSKMEYFQHLSAVKPKYVFCDLEYYAIMKDCISNLKIEAKFFTFGGQIEESVSINNLFEKDNIDLYFVPTKVNGITDTAFIIQTSGTSGIPKAICFSHAAILDKIRRLSQIIRSTDVVLGFENWHFVTGVRVLFGATLNGSTRIVNEGSFSPERFFDLVERFEVTFALNSVIEISQLLDHPRIESADLSSLKYYTCGGMKIPYEIVQKMNKYLKGGRFCHNYGMTELLGSVAINLYHTRNASAGQLISGCEVKIINERGERLGVDEDGELCIRQPYPFLRHLLDDDHENEIVHNNFDNEGFFATGDIAHFDQNNDLFIIGRKKDLFKSCGDYTVIPIEMEEFLNQIDGVQQSCVVPIPDVRYHNLPAAVIVKTKRSNCSAESIYDAVRDNFAPYKHLQGGVYFVDSLPLTNSGKVVRHLVTEMAINLYDKQKNR
ncbi:uncharacterized protein LOC129573305 [Sitodiplosis mosellana]|uniref:uncharacterized protein LOC129573305 n=1 Tax=Sitodiplosis mosellana TaxID=263140 RepID=UPI002445311C|nr:uncharacterized protein LOC129573305 [Sitodiplosis mosellana]XP_055309668.1 uncharacterized protein LOC129573305 [Sitodiplosis mosellana]XP_055309669.1 uncharacterized protein LOC129573305 [Sitodiplosis mosellana]